MSRKGKQRGVDIKQEDILQAVVRKTLIGQQNRFFKYRPIRECIFKISNLDFPCYYFWVHATVMSVFKTTKVMLTLRALLSSDYHIFKWSEVVFCPIRIQDIYSHIINKFIFRNIRSIHDLSMYFQKHPWYTYRFSFSCPWVTIFLHSRELN